MDELEFLQTVVTTPTGRFCLSIRDGTSWQNLWYDWPMQADSIIARATAEKESKDVYFSCYLSSCDDASKACALPTRTISADLDAADLATIPIQPSIIVKTSHERHQGFWILTEEATNHETLSRRLTYSIQDADPTGWPIGKKVRFPNTLNHKYEPSPVVEVTSITGRTYHPTELEILPDVDLQKAKIDTVFVEDTIPILNGMGPLELLEHIKSNIPGRVYAQYNIKAADRSAALWALMCCAFRAGLTREQVLFLAHNSANNKFSFVRDLAKDVLRAEKEAFAPGEDGREILDGVRRVQHVASLDKMRLMLATTIEVMRRMGEFVATSDDDQWFILKSDGRPIHISIRSERLSVFLDTTLGLNYTDKETKYIVSGLNSFAKTLPVTGTLAQLSHYDSSTNSMLLHTGRKHVLRITPHHVETLVNGSNGVVFPWITELDQFNPIVPDSSYASCWGDTIFQGSLDNLTNMDQEEALALLKVWLLSILFKGVFTAKPLIAFFGKPGCISGETEVDIKRGKHGYRTFTLAHIYNSFHGRWDSSIPSRILSNKNGEVSPRTIKDVVYSGIKPTYTVKVQDCKPFRTTLDHRFLTDDGYKRLEELAIGDYVRIKGSNLFGLGRTEESRYEVMANYHPHASFKMVGNYGPYGRISHARAVLEARLNNLSESVFLHIIHNWEDKAATLQYLPKEVAIHHKDENPSNDEPSNLEVLTKLKHDTYHGFNNVRNFGYFSGMFDTALGKVESIEYYGEEDTYDIEMEDEDAPNFLINDVVVHNSGKSTLAKKIYAFLYGKQMKLGKITDDKSFDTAVSKYPLYIFDNVDTWERWLPDRLAQMAGDISASKKKLYTDNDMVTVTGSAHVGVTAFDPKFNRPDVVDRFIVFTFERIHDFLSEDDLVGSVLLARNRLWGHMVRDIQSILSTPRPPNQPVSLRSSDLVHLGRWAAVPLNLEAFEKAVHSLQMEQVKLTLRGDQPLVEALMAYAQHCPTAHMFKTAGRLWLDLTLYSSKANVDSGLLLKRYKSATNLDGKLWVLQESLSSLIKIEWKENLSREWMICVK